VVQKLWKQQFVAGEFLIQVEVCLIADAKLIVRDNQSERAV